VDSKLALLFAYEKARPAVSRPVAASGIRAGLALCVVMCHGCSLVFGFSGFSGGDRDAGASDVDAKLTDAGGEGDAGADAPGDSGGAEAADVGAPTDAASPADAIDAGDVGSLPDATEAGPADAGEDAPDSSHDGASSGGITLVQQAGSHFTTATRSSQASETFPSPTTAGNTIVVLGFWDVLGFAASATDSLGNTYASTAVVSNPQGGALQIFYVPRSAAGADTVTLTMSAGFNAFVGLAIFEYAGLASSNVLEGTAGQYAPSATASASTPTMATSSNTLLLAGFADLNGSGVIAPGPGWTGLVTNTDFYMLAEVMIVQASPAIAASATMPTLDNRWLSLMAAFQAGP
jgi:hypothetical protein